MEMDLCYPKPTERPIASTSSLTNHAEIKEEAIAIFTLITENQSLAYEHQESHNSEALSTSTSSAAKINVYQIYILP
jgi:hypothetical protein